jgi:hypothetical protein
MLDYVTFTPLILGTEALKMGKSDRTARTEALFWDVIRRDQCPQVFNKVRSCHK